MPQEETELVLSCNTPSILKELPAGKMWKISGQAGEGGWFFHTWLIQVKLCWTVQLVHQIFTRGSAISVYFYYLVFIHQSLNTKHKSPRGYLLSGTKNYWKIPSISTLSRQEQTESTLSGQTQYDCLSEHLASLAAKAPLSDLYAEKIPRQLAFLWMLLLPCSPQFLQHPQSYSASSYHQICSCFYFVLYLLSTAIHIVIKGFSACLYLPSVWTGLYILSCKKAKGKTNLSLLHLREYVLNQTISVK